MRIDNGRNTFSGLTNIDPANLQGGVLSPNPLPAPYNISDTAYGIHIQGGTNTFSGQLIAPSATVITGGTTNFTGTGSQLGTLDVSGTAKVNIAAAGMVLGQIIIGNGGEVVFDNVPAAITSITVNAGGKLRFTSTIGINNPSITINGGTVELETHSPFPNAPINVGAGGATFVAKYDAGGSSFDNPITLGNGNVIFDWVGIGTASVAFRYGGVLSGQGNLIKRGANFLNLTGANAFTGTVTVEAGELLIGAQNALPTSTSLDVSRGAIVNLATNSQTISSLTGSGQVQGTSASRLSVGSSNSSEFAGVLAGDMSITKIGTARSLSAVAALIPVPGLWRLVNWLLR